MPTIYSNTCVFVLKKFNEPYTGYLQSDRVSKVY